MQRSLCSCVTVSQYIRSHQLSGQSAGTESQRLWVRVLVDLTFHYLLHMYGNALCPTCSMCCCHAETGFSTLQGTQFSTRRTQSRTCVSGWQMGSSRGMSCRRPSNASPPQPHTTSRSRHATARVTVRCLRPSSIKHLKVGLQ